MWSYFDLSFNHIPCCFAFILSQSCIVFLLLLDRYLLEFDDDEEDGALPQRAVPFYNVVALPEGHRQ